MASRSVRTPAGPYESPEVLFASTERYYLRFRPGYPAVLLDYLAACAAGRVLDLGSGPGVVARELARRGCAVLALDPNPRMLKVGRAAAAQERVTGVEWRRGDSGCLADLAAAGQFAAVTIADAFHWMDREHALAALDGLVAPGGFVAVMGSRAAGTPKPWWETILDRVRGRHLGPHRHAGAGVLYQEPGADHEAVLRNSPFPRITAMRADYPLRYTADELVGLQYTYAFSSPAVLGANRDRFERDVRRALAAAEPSGVFTALSQAYLLVGRRA